METEDELPWWAVALIVAFIGMGAYAAGANANRHAAEHAELMKCRAQEFPR